MAKLIAIEWDQQELRIAAGTRHGSTVAVDALHSISLVSDPPLTNEEMEAKLASSLAMLISQNGLSRHDAVIAAGRASVELRSMSLPPATDNELPEMVRFAAQRAFAQLGDSWPIDFVRLPSDTENVQVLAAAMSPTIVAKVKKYVEQAGLTPKRLMLRPLGNIALTLSAHPAIRNQAALIVNIVGDEIDLIVCDKGGAGLIRTARLPQGESSIRQRALASEIKRTRIASESQTPSVRPSHLVLWGDLGGGVESATGLTEQTGMEVTQLALRKVVDINASVKVVGDDYERFVPVVGLLHHALHPETPSIDFMSPRKRLEKKKPILQMSLAAGLAMLLLGYGGWWYYSEHKELSDQIAQLQKDSKDLDAIVKVAQEKVSNWTTIEKFLQSDVQWLDELAYLSEKSLPADKMLVGAPTFSTAPNGASISAQIATTERDLLTAFEEALKDGHHVVVGKGANQINPPYQWSGNPTIRIPLKTASEVAAIMDKPEKVIPPETEATKQAAESQKPNAPSPSDQPSPVPESTIPTEPASQEMPSATPPTTESPAPVPAPPTQEPPAPTITPSTTPEIKPPETAVGMTPSPFAIAKSIG